MPSATVSSLVGGPSIDLFDNFESSDDLLPQKEHRGQFEPSDDPEEVYRCLKELGGVIIKSCQDAFLEIKLRKEGILPGEKHIINTRKDVENGNVETGKPGRLQVLVRERGKMLLKHRLAQKLAHAATKMGHTIRRALGKHKKLLPPELKCGKLRTEAGAKGQPSHFDVYEGATDIECFAAIKPVVGGHRNFYIRPGSHKVVKAGCGKLAAEVKVRVYDDEIFVISSLVVHRGGEGPDKGQQDHQAVHMLFAPPDVKKEHVEDIVIFYDEGFTGEIEYLCVDSS